MEILRGPTLGFIQVWSSNGRGEARGAQWDENWDRSSRQLKHPAAHVHG